MKENRPDCSGSRTGASRSRSRWTERLFGWVKNAGIRINTYTDNLNLRTKMIIMCIACVLIPVVATNCIFWSMVYRAEQDRVDLQMEDLYANTEGQLDGLRQSLSTMAATFYTNTGLYTFLDTSYADNIEYLTAYRTYIDPLSVVYGNNTYISNFVIYADNETLINGGGVGRLSSVKDTEWYRKYKESGDVMTMCSYYDDQSDTRTISLIRRLDYAGKGIGRRERILKLDLSYGYYNRIMSRQRYTADIYIYDDEHILFSNTDPSNGAMPFRSASEVNAENAVHTSVYDIFGSKWKVCLLSSDESSDLSVSSIITSKWPLLMVMMLINILLPFAVVYLINRSITTRLRVLAKHLNMVKDEQFEEIIMPQAKDEVGDLVRDYNLMTFKMRELIEDVYKERLHRQENELHKQRAELQALHSQINPHFMFNSLESIRMRSLIKGENETAEIIELLAVMMRKSTDWCDDLVTISSEASFAETYLRLQQYRFGSRLSYRINISPDCAELRVPKLSIVTFVENACVHGVEGVRHNCVILLSVEKDEEALRISVEDTGAGMSEERCEELLNEMRNATFDDLRTSKSVGIINACLRLKKCFGIDVDFELDSEEGAGLCVTIIIPIECFNI